MKQNEPTSLNKILQVMVVCCFLFIAIYVIWGIAVSPKLALFRETAYIYDEEWIKEESDGTLSIHKMPMSLDLSDDEIVTITTTLPLSVEEGEYLAINTGKSFRMYLDGSEIYVFDNSISKLPGNITKAVIVPIPLKESYAGKQLTMVIINGKYDRSSINTAYIGSLMGIVTILVKSFGVQLVLAMILTLASIITIGIFLYLEKRDNRKAPLIHLAEGILSICLWITFDSPLFQMIFGKYFFDGIAGFMLVTTMGMPFLMYFDEISEYRRHKIFATFEAIAVVNFIVLTFLHLTGIRSYDKSLIYVDLVLLVDIGVMIVCTIKYYIDSEDKSHINVISGLVGLSIFSFLEIVVTILNAKFPFKVDIAGLCVLAGMIILLYFAILDQVKVFETLKQETQTALAASKAKSDFLANMSHEIRTPINAIMGMNEMILRESNQDNVKEYAKDIESASDNLLRIVNDILDFSKIESGKLEIICDNYDLGEVIYDVTTFVSMKAEYKGLKLNIAVDDGLPAKLYGDDKRIREIITNILNNAVKYTEKGYVNLKIGGTIEGNIVTLNISVEDSGQGISKEDIDKIFNEFSQANVKINKNIEGTGLGLAITKRLIELMDGTISVESELGKGSTFIVVLPQKIVSDEKMGNYMSHRHVSSAQERDKTFELELPAANILVVDDTSLNLKVISRLFDNTAVNVTCAFSGEEMLELVQNNKFDIIYLDHMMPNMDGIEALRAFKVLENNMSIDAPVIALTANAIVGSKEMYLEVGFDDYLSKPVNMEELKDTILKYYKKEI